MQGRLELAVADFDEAIRLDPSHTRAWALRGQVRLRQGRFDDATKDLDRALELEPGFYETLVQRALANLGGGRVEAARRDLDVVVRDRPNHVRGKFSRGLLDLVDRRFAEAIADLSRGMDDPVLRPFGLPYRARTFLGLGARAAAAAAADAEELIDLRPRDGFSLMEAVRIWTEAFAADPKLGEDRQSPHRYNAACAATLAGSGQGEVEPKLDDAARVELRGQALAWLRAEMEAWTRFAQDADPARKGLVAQTLAHWKVDGDLARVRDADALARLPEAERKPWQALWSEVDRLLAKVSQK
jgi:serine/threonine-protein kinase